jgi:crotonyl-CoA reductase
VVSNEEKAEICRAMGAELIINRSEQGYRFWKDEHTQDPAEWRRFGKDIRELTGGEDVDIVFEHPGRETFGASVYAARQGRHDRHLRLDERLHAPVRQPLPLDEPQADHRLALRQLPRVVGGQPADREGDDPPHAVPGVPARGDRQAALDVHRNAHQGKVGVLCLAPEEGLGVRDASCGPPTSRRSTASGASEPSAFSPTPARRGGRTPADRGDWTA